MLREFEIHLPARPARAVAIDRWWKSLNEMEQTRLRRAGGDAVSG
jgi:hypothetical protein